MEVSYPLHPPLPLGQVHWEGMVECGPLLTLRTLQDPVRTSQRLVKKAPRLVNFANIPITESECSRVLRLATVQHFIFNVICESLWNPFFSTYLWQHNRERSALIDIYSNLAAYGENVQRNWKVSTLKVLDKLDEEVNAREMIDDLIATNIIGFLSPLLEDNQDDQFRSELATVFNNAIRLGKMAERDPLPVYIDRAPSMSDKTGWFEYLSEEDETTDGEDDLTQSQTSSAMGSSFRQDALFVHPKISRREAPTRTAAATPTTATEAALGGSRPLQAVETALIQPGLALFPVTGIFQRGASEWYRISNAPREAARNINDRTAGRRSSMSVTNSGILPSPRSPTLASRGWPRSRTQDFE
jgi:hypothetical protein